MFETFPAGEENDNTWEEKVKSLLESIPTVRDVEISGVDFFSVPEGPWQEGDLWESDEILLTPHPDTGRLSFRVTVPVRIQREIIDRTGIGRAFSEIESFYVVTFYRGFPVTFVFAEGGPGPHSMGSEGVRILRIFLEEESKRYRADDSIRFTSTGPSPFQYDFMLRAGTEEMHGGFQLERIPREGIDEYIITYGTADYDSAYAAIPIVCRHLARELGIFYRSQRMRDRRARTMDGLRSWTDQLLSMTLQGGGRAKLLRFLRARKLASNLQLSLIATEYRFQVEERDSQSMLQNPGNVGSVTFQDEIRANIKAVFQEELTNMNNIVDLVASRQKRDVDITMLLITSLLGGIVGTILTLVLTVFH